MADPITALQALRELTEGDLALPRTKAEAQVRIGRVTALHHAKARMLAAGKPPGQVAACLGTTKATLESLLDDPTFQELVEYYRTQEDALWVETRELVSLNARMALEEIRERLDIAPKDFSNKELREMAGDFLDRTGLPRQSGLGTGQATPTTITFNFGRELERAGPTIEAQAEQVGAG